VGLVMGAVGIALVAVVVADVWFRSRTQVPDSSSGTSPDPAVVAVSDAGTPPVVVTAPPPAPALADAGAVAATPSTPPESPQGTVDGSTGGTAVAGTLTPAPALGSLVVQAKPFATVLVNGKSYEVQGSKTIRLPPGTYQLVFKHPNRTEPHSITIEPNGTVKKSFRYP
jgi:serine/threonine-protein kinase